MKPVLFRSLLAGSAMMVFGTLAFAQTPAVDPHPFQSQTSIRTTDARMGNGFVESLPAVTAAEWKYLIPGGKGPQSAFNTALMYDKRTIVGPTVAAGGNYAFDASGYMYTISGEGFCFRQSRKDFKPGTLGGVFFVDTATGHLILVDSYGSVFDSLESAPAIRVAGGNYLIDSMGTLTTFKSMGLTQTNVSGMMTTMKDGSNFSNVTQAGGNFFVKSDNTIVTISSVTGFYSAPFTPDAPPREVGGNYFVGTDNLLYTVSNAGVLKKNTEYTIGAIAMKGSSFLKFTDGTFIFVDGTGMPHRSAMHVGLNANSSEPTTVLPDAIDPNSIFLPKIIH